MNKKVITIARSYGSGGRTLGRKLALDLGIKCYDRELVRMASDESGINEALFGEADENIKRKPFFHIPKDAYKGEVLPPDHGDFTSAENLFRYQAKVIRDLADKESCVIVGRCGDYVLQDYDNVIRLFFYASEDNCIRRVVAQQGVNEKEAKERIARIDKYRANYYKFYTGHDWYDAHNYDLCMDTASMDYDKLIRVVKAYLKECE